MRWPGGGATDAVMVTEVVTGDVEGGKKLQRYLNNLAIRLGQGATVSVGFLEGATYPAAIERDRKNNFKPQGKNAKARQAKAAASVLSVAQVAFWSEYGTKHQPPRPFFRNMIADQSPTWAHKLGVAMRYTGYRPKQALEIVAADIKGHLVESINMLQDPPLADYTVEKKGFSKPLIDTAVMVRAPSWVVTMGAPTR